MERRFDSVLNHRGEPIEGVSVLVKTASGATATIYEDDGVTTTPNPLTTDENGEFGYYAADGVYSWTLTYPNADTKIIPGIVHANASGIPMREAPVGTVDGVNDTFTLTQIPLSGTFQLFVNGLAYRDTTDFTLTGSTIVYSSGAKPGVGDNHYAYYRY